MAAWPMDKSGTAGPANDQNLAELVWKYFEEELIRVLQEAQQALAPKKGLSTTPKPQKR